MPRFAHAKAVTEVSSWRALVFATTVLLGAVASALAGAGPAAAATPTTPPPVSILSSQPGFGHGEDLFITPVGDTETYAQGPEILEHERPGDLVPGGPARRGGD